MDPFHFTTSGTKKKSKTKESSHFRRQNDAGLKNWPKQADGSRQTNVGKLAKICQAPRLLWEGGRQLAGPERHEYLKFPHCSRDPVCRTSNWACRPRKSEVPRLQTQPFHLLGLPQKNLKCPDSSCKSTAFTRPFFCSMLLGKVPGGSPFSQLH